MQPVVWEWLLNTPLAPLLPAEGSQSLAVGVPHGMQLCDLPPKVCHAVPRCSAPVLRTAGVLFLLDGGRYGVLLVSDHGVMAKSYAMRWWHPPVARGPET